MTSSPTVCRAAEVRLRRTIGSRSTRIYWPSPTGPPRPLLALFDIGAPSDTADFDVHCRNICSASDFIVLSVRYAPASRSFRSDIVPDALSVLQWAADHAAELNADPARLLVGGEHAGGPLAAAVGELAHEQGWPPILRIHDLRQLRRTP
ncbi:alpha/beta hydrolase [Nocardia sp. NBC_00403]|uniref:alpha/beta hydrolase n=1 Tax=Nocardia sp. NBC_00403 TaxID=2975990 RepID=UPI002E24A1AF